MPYFPMPGPAATARQNTMRPGAPMSMNLTGADWKHLVREYEREAEGDDAWDGPADVMTSRGYVGLWPNGDVTASGAILGNVADHGADVRW